MVSLSYVWLVKKKNEDHRRDWTNQKTEVDLGRANVTAGYEIKGGILLTGQIVSLSCSCVIYVNIISIVLLYAIALT